MADVAREAIYNFERAHLSISGKGAFSPVMNPPPFSVIFTEVEVDVETGEVAVLNILYVADPGRTINPATGALESDNLNTYKLPSILDMPEIEVVLYEEPVPSGPFGAKGITQGAMGATGIRCKSPSSPLSLSM